VELDLYKKPFALVGVNIGAAIATDFAACFPKLVGQLICIDYNPVSIDSMLTYCKVQGAEHVPDISSAVLLLASPLLKEQKRSLASAQRLAPIVFAERGDALGLKPKMDPDFVFSATQASLGHSLACVQCKTLFLHERCSEGKAVEDLNLIGGLNKRIAFAQIEKSQGFSVADSPFEVYSEMKRALNEDESIFAVADKSARTAETLGLRPLPTFQTLEEAFKALGPRKIPTKEVVEAELDRLRKEDGYVSSDDEGDNGPQANEYFGFVG